MRWKLLYNTHYKISDTGLVENTKTGKRLKPKDRPYPTVGISVAGKYSEYALHRAVADHFVPNPEKLPIVRHIDNNKKNYTADNLCWGTYSDNLQDAILAGANCVGRLVLRKKDGHIIQVHRSLADAARTVGLASPSNGGASHIKAVCEGHGKTLKGFTFEYAKEGASYPLE